MDVTPICIMGPTGRTGTFRLCSDEPMTSRALRNIVLQLNLYAEFLSTPDRSQALAFWAIEWEHHRDSGAVRRN